MTAVIAVGIAWPIVAAAIATVPHRARRAQPRVRPALTVLDGGRS